MELRAYQKEAVAAVESQWARGVKSTLVVMATGTGKTVVMGELARRCVENGGRVLFLAHRDLLLTQGAAKLREAIGDELAIGLEQGDSTAKDDVFIQGYKIVIASVQTLGKSRRLHVYYPGYFTHVFIDEAHHSTANAYHEIIDYFNSANVLGVTATPDRADRASLRDVFQSVAYEYGLAEAVKNETLCPIRAELVPLEIDLRGVRQTKGDYDQGDSGKALETCLHAIVAATQNEMRGRRTVVFTPLIKTAHKMREEYAAAGFVAREIDGATRNRNEVLAAFAREEIDVLCNAMLLTEGVDVPEVNCIVVLRPTNSRALYTQMVGRGTRLCPGKTELLLFDFLWLTEKLDICRPTTLMCDSPDIDAAALSRMQECPGQAVDLVALVRDVGADVEAQRERALIRALKAQSRKDRRRVDPIQYAVSVKEPSLYDYKPTAQEDCENPTAEQLKELMKQGIDIDQVETYWLAEALLKSLLKRGSADMATPKQVRMLERRGYCYPGEWTKKEASYVMLRLSRNGWRAPADLDPIKYLPKRLREQGYLPWG